MPLIRIDIIKGKSREYKKTLSDSVHEVLIGVHENNTGSRKTVEKCGGVYENTVTIEGDPEPIRRYWIKQ